MDKSTQALLNTLITSIVIGGGTSLLVKSIADSIDLHRKKKFEDDIKKSTDPIIVKTSNDKEMWGPNLVALKYISALVGGLGSAYGINKLYDYFKSKNVNADKDEAEEDYYATLALLKRIKQRREENSSNVHFASVKSAGIGAEITGGLLALIALAAGASMYMSRSYLKDTYPILDNSSMYSEAKKNLPIRRVKFLKDESNETKNDDDLKDILDKDTEEAEQKLASIVTDRLKDEVSETILKLASKIEDADPKFNLGINNIINAVAIGDFNIIKSANSTEDIFNTSEYCVRKYAENNINLPSELKKQLAISYIACDPVLSPNVIPFAASAIINKFSVHNKLASFDSDDIVNRMDNSLIVTLMNIHDRNCIFKQACKNNDKLKDISYSHIDANNTSLFREGVEKFLFSDC